MGSSDGFRLLKAVGLYFNPSNADTTTTVKERHYAEQPKRQIWEGRREGGITLDESRLRAGRGQAGKDWDGSSSNSQIGYP